MENSERTKREDQIGWLGCFDMGDDTRIKGIVHSCSGKNYFSCCFIFSHLPEPKQGGFIPILKFWRVCQFNLIAGHVDRGMAMDTWTGIWLANSEVDRLDLCMVRDGLVFGKHISLCLFFFTASSFLLTT